MRLCANHKDAIDVAVVAVVAIPLAVQQAPGGAPQDNTIRVLANCVGQQVQARAAQDTVRSVRTRERGGRKSTGRTDAAT